MQGVFFYYDYYISMADKEKKEYPIATHRHSLAHIMAQAVQRLLDPDVKLGIGPAIDNGFYYDFIFSEGIEFHEAQLKPINKLMQQIIKEKQEFVHYESNFEESETILKMFGQEFKLDLLNKFKEEGDTKVTYYLNVISEKAAEFALKDAAPTFKKKYEIITDYFRTKIPTLEGKFITFADLCEGPHVDDTGELVPNAFKASKIAGAYWRGDANNPMMTRIYGYAFENKQGLTDHINFLEEAKKRDHRVLGQKLKLFTISPLVGAGLPLFHPNGTILRQELEKFLRSMHKDKGYQKVRTPHLAKESLYECSGHAGHYLDDMFKVKGGSSGEDFFVKPMNCPHHMQLFADNNFSYRDMPVKYFEPGTVYRDEKSWQLSGLTRVRCITQDDGHLFCRVSQIKEEVGTIVEIIKQFYQTMGMMDEYWVSLSVRDYSDTSKYMGDSELWDNAENALEELAQEQNIVYKKIEGEAAFYGPKLDFMFKDAIKRERQLATIQLDFNLPERFDLSFVNEEGEKERPVVIHRAICGSLERCIGVLTEHFMGAFPVWLAPTQVTILTVADAFNDHGAQVQKQLQEAGLRVKLDNSTDSLNKKIRNAEMMKIPYILVIGEKEQTENTVSVREYRSKKQYELPTSELVTQVSKEYKERALEKTN